MITNFLDELTSAQKRKCRIHQTFFFKQNQGKPRTKNKQVKNIKSFIVFKSNKMQNGELFTLSKSMNTKIFGVNTGKETKFNNYKRVIKQCKKEKQIKEQNLLQKQTIQFIQENRRNIFKIQTKRVQSQLELKIDQVVEQKYQSQRSKQSINSVKKLNPIQSNRQFQLTQRTKSQSTVQNLYQLNEFNYVNCLQLKQKLEFMHKENQFQKNDMLIRNEQIMDQIKNLNSKIVNLNYLQSKQISVRKSNNQINSFQANSYQTPRN